MKARQTVLLLEAILVWLAFCAVPVVRGDNVFLDDFPEDSSKGRFVIEAEHYSSRNSSAEAGWWEVDGGNHEFIEGPNDRQEASTAGKAGKGTGARGNYMVVKGLFSFWISPSDSSYDGAFMDYRVAVETPGTYRLYARWLGVDQGSDSFYIFILKPDGTVPKGAGPDYFMFHQFRSSWHWDNRGVGSSPHSTFAGKPGTAVWRIKEAGEYTIRVMQREQRTALDTLVFQTEDLPLPDDSELAESRFVDKPIENKEIFSVRGQLQAALGERRAALRTIDAALARETQLYEALEDLLASGEYGDLSRWNVIEAQQKVRRMIETETQSRKALVKAIEELKGALQTLGWRPPPPPEPVAYWSFNEGQGTTVNDSAGNNNGTILGAEWTSGKFNSALSFDGVDDYVEVGDDPSLRFMQSSSFTISFWVMPVSASGYEGGCIVSKMRSWGQSGGSGVWTGRLVSRETKTRSGILGSKRLGIFGYHAAWSSSSSAFYFVVESSWKGSVGTLTGNNSAPAGNWYHVVGVYSDKEVRVYLNGELRGRRTFDLETGSTTPDKSLVIGAMSYDSTIKAFFGGKIDEVRIYDGALSDAEIWSLYENGSL
jgi:hypothetical protein